VNIYLAAAWSRRAEMQKLTKKLERDIPGLIVKARWIKVEPPEKTFWQRTARENTRLALEDREDAITTDVLVRFTDDLNSKTVPSQLATGSRMVEMGMAIIAGVSVIVVGGKQNLFDCLPEVQHVKNVAALKRLLRKFSRVIDGGVVRHISQKRLAKLSMKTG
jgi:hypothetical protein